MKNMTMLILIGVLGITFVLKCEGNTGNSPFANKRAILDGDIGLWTKKEELDQRLIRIKEAGFNVYMPAVWYGRGTTWPSRIAPWDFTLTAKGTKDFDPLRYAIAKAHELGLEIHPWFTVVLQWKRTFLPEFGLDGVSEGQFGAFNVHDASFREFMKSLITEVVSNYNIDGINLDYGRAMGLCTSSLCQQEYRILYNRNLLVDSLAFKLSPQKVPTLIQYQELAVRALIKSISASAKKIKPALLVSVDAHPELARYEQGQNSIDWANSGLVDVVFMMNYHPALDPVVIETVRSKMSNPKELTLLISNMAYGADLSENQKPFPRSGKWLSETIAMIATRWPDTGIAVYFYKYLSDEQISALKAGTFRGSPDREPPHMPELLSVR